MKPQFSALHDASGSARLQNLTLALLVAFTAVALALIYWSVIRAPAIQAREDNPRLVEAELRIQRGRILDRNGVVLAETQNTAAALQRFYPIATIGPAVGYYSFRYGTAGVEESFNERLRGDAESVWEELWRQAVHRPQTGQDIQLTLDAGLQETADGLLGNHSGALILLSLPDAEILALASHPGYDPNRLDEQFDQLAEAENAPLLNRVTQAQYQPGMILQPFILAATIDQGLAEPGDRVAAPDEPVSIGNNVTMRCVGAPPSPAAWTEILRHRCPGPMVALADQLGAAGLDKIFTDFGLTRSPSLPLNTEVAETQPLVDPLLAGIGQENLTVTPLQVSQAWAALATDGRIPTLRLVTAVEDKDGNWQPITKEEEDTPERAISAAVATLLRQNLLRNEGISEYSVLVLAGPGGSTNAWYLGLAPASAPDYAVVVVVENSTSISAAEKVGREVLAAAVQE